MDKLRFGIIGCGMMGKEFGSAAARWCHLSGNIPAPEIVGVANRSPEGREWFRRIPTVKYFEMDYRELLKREDIEAVYCAVTHDQHEKIYTDILEAGKHLMGEKPFGIDKKANKSIVDAVDRHPELFARCASQLPFFPGCQELIKWYEEGRFGRIIEVKAGFNHSSDMDVEKPANWKRMVELNGEYGCVGDLGMHTLYVPIRLGFDIKSVYASLSNIIKERPDGKGGRQECGTWDNVTMACDCEDKNGDGFPMFIETKRMAPGATNEWYLEIYGMDASAKFTTNDANAFYYTSQGKKEQAWCRLGIGYKAQFPTISGHIFEFGFSDAILQMWAAFMAEAAGQEVGFGCMLPEETLKAHAVMSAAIKSGKTRRAEEALI